MPLLAVHLLPRGNGITEVIEEERIDRSSVIEELSVIHTVYCGNYFGDEMASNILCFKLSSSIFEEV